jgi:hypothetical protein
VIGFDRITHVCDVDRVLVGRVAFVFAAAVLLDGRPTLMPADLVDAAVDLYRAGRVCELLTTSGTVDVKFLILLYPPELRGEADRRYQTAQVRRH